MSAWWRSRRNVSMDCRRLPSRVWSWYARGGAGYDDNVALRSESVDTPGSGEGDAFGQLLLSGSFSFRPLWRVDGAAGLLSMRTSMNSTRALFHLAWRADCR